VRWFAKLRRVFRCRQTRRDIGETLQTPDRPRPVLSAHAGRVVGPVRPDRASALRVARGDPHATARPVLADIALVLVSLADRPMPWNTRGFRPQVGAEKAASPVRVVSGGTTGLRVRLKPADAYIGWGSEGGSLNAGRPALGSSTGLCVRSRAGHAYRLWAARKGRPLKRRPAWPRLSGDPSAISAGRFGHDGEAPGKAARRASVSGCVTPCPRAK